MEDVYMPIQGFKHCDSNEELYTQFDVGMLEIMPIGLRMAFMNSCPKSDQYSKGE
jgi:hypothetical protein